MTSNFTMFITLTLNCTHLNNIKAMVNIATSSANTYLQFLVIAVNDASGNPVEATFVNDSFAAVNASDSEDEVYDASSKTVESVVSCGEGEDV